jgi:hypothetical protein
MALDFPASPTDGQLYTGANGVVYRYSTTRGLWQMANVAETALVSDTPPVTPSINQLWFNSALGQMFIWYNDGNTTQWVPVSAVASQQPVGWRLLSRVVPTAGQVNIDFTNLPSDINDLNLYFDVAATTNNSNLFMQFYDGAGVLDAGASHYLTELAYIHHAMAAGAALGAYNWPSTSSAICFNLNTTNWGVYNVTGSSMRGDVRITNIRDAAFRKTAAFHVAYLESTATYYATSFGTGVRFWQASAISGLRLFFSGSGFQAGGAVSLWGSP